MVRDQGPWSVRRQRQDQLKVRSQGQKRSQTEKKEGIPVSRGQIQGQIGIRAYRDGHVKGHREDWIVRSPGKGQRTKCDSINDKVT